MHALEALLILVVAGIVLLVPVGALLGFLSFRATGRHARRVEELDRELAGLRQEIAYLKSVPPTEPPEETPSLDLDMDLGPEPERLESEPVTRPVAAVTVDKPARMADSVPPTPEPEVPAENPLLAALKENWMVWLGALSVSLAGIFMVSHSITAGLIGPTQQFLLALSVGLVLHVGAEFLRRRHMGSDQIFAALAGGGSVTLYAALVAGVHLFDLLGPATALVALALVSLVTMLLALVAEALVEGRELKKEVTGRLRLREEDDYLAIESEGRFELRVAGKKNKGQFRASDGGRTITHWFNLEGDPFRTTNLVGAGSLLQVSDPAATDQLRGTDSATIEILENLPAHLQRYTDGYTSIDLEWRG